MASFIKLSVSPSSSSTTMFIHHHKPSSIKRCTRMISYSTSHDIHIQATSLLKFRSSIKLHKIFEDESSGVVCYRDEKGEITCEGYDEGPRFHRMLTFDQRQCRGEAEVIELLHRRLLEIVDKSETAKQAAADKDDINSNGFF